MSKPENPHRWEAPRPSWVDEVADLVARAERLTAKITEQVARYIRWQRRFWLIVMAAAFVGQWLGWGSVELVKWWAVP